MKGAVDRDWAHVTPNQDFDGEGGGFGNLRQGVRTVDIKAVYLLCWQGRFAPQDQAQ